MTTDTPTRPNLFALATKELSQDAFLGWLCEWADPKYAQEDRRLNACGMAFLQALLGKKDDIHSVRAKLQWKSIDVRVIVNEQYFILIEDKTYTSHHSDQLARYKELAEEYRTEEGKRLEVIPIYLKTGNEALNILEEVSENKYRQFLRSDILAILEQHAEIENHIYKDYLHHLRNVESWYDYEATPVKEWKSNHWEGFFMAIEGNAIMHWHWVNNLNGGFMNGLMTWDLIDGHPVYMQLEQDRLCFKLEASRQVGEETKTWIEDSTERASLRTHFHELIMNTAKGTVYDQRIKRPQRFGNGTWMTLAYVDLVDWMTQDQWGKVVLEPTVDRLKEYMAFMRKVIEKGQPVATGDIYAEIRKIINGTGDAN